MINIAIYARKSKSTETGDSIDTQIQKCKSYMESTLEINDTIQYHYYSDEGFSGASTDRPEFQRLLSDVKEGKLNYLVCYKLDRIARCLLDFESIHRLLEAHNVFLLSCIDRFDTSSENGKAFMRILLVFAELERGNIALRIKDAMLNLAESGFWSGGTAPIGYKTTKYATTKAHSNNVRKLTTLTLDEDYAPTVRLIFDKYLELGSISAVDTYLLQHNVTTRSGANFRTNTIREILRNPTYCSASPEVYRYFISLGCSLSFSEDECIDTLSFIQYNRTKKKVEKKGQVDEVGSTKKTTLKNDPSEWIIALGVHQAIIPSIQWLKVQQQLAQNADKRFGSSSGSTSKIGLLNGLLFCSKCGAPMRIMGHSVLSDGTLSYSYRCNTKVRSKGTLCNADNVLGHYLDPYIIEQVKHLLSNQETFIEQLKEHHNASMKYHIDNLNTEPLLDKKLSEIEKDISNLMSRLMKCTSDIVAEEIEKGIETLKNAQKITLIELEKIRNLKQDINTSKNNIQTLIDFLQDFTHSIDDASLNEKRVLLQNIISRIEWNGDTKEVNIFFITDSRHINNSTIHSSTNNDSYFSNHPEYHEFRHDFLRESNCNLYTGSKCNTTTNYGLEYELYKHTVSFDIKTINFSSSPQPSNLGNALKHARLKLNLSQKEVSELVGVHADTIYLLEKNKSKVHVNYIFKLEEVLQTSLKGYDEYYDFARDTITNIKAIRKILRMTQAEFAQYLGICKTTVGKWECGLSHIPRKQYKILKSKELI